MSKRHRKTKDMMALNAGVDILDFEPIYTEARHQRKAKGKQRRQSLKRAYYDD